LVSAGDDCDGWPEVFVVALDSTPGPERAWAEAEDLADLGNSCAEVSHLDLSGDPAGSEPDTDGLVLAALGARRADAGVLSPEGVVRSVELDFPISIVGVDAAAPVDAGDGPRRLMVVRSELAGATPDLIVAWLQAHDAGRRRLPASTDPGHDPGRFPSLREQFTPNHMGVTEVPGAVLDELVAQGVEAELDGLVSRAPSVERLAALVDSAHLERAVRAEGP